MKNILITAVLFLLCWAASFLMRTWHYNTSVYELGKAMKDVPAYELKKPGIFPEYHKNFAPFTIESGMMYAYAQDIATGKGVPECDPLLNGLEHIPPYAQMSMELEWFLGWGWRIKNFISPDPEPGAAEKRYQDHPRMAQWMSGQLRLWASLTSALLFLWLAVMGCPRKFAVPAGLLHAFSPAAIARATGQDIVRGEFAIPLILGALVLGYSLFTAPKLWKAVLLGLVTAMAFAGWDLCQMIFGVWACFELLRFTLGHKLGKGHVLTWSAVAAGVLIAALTPAGLAYDLWRTPFACVILPSLSGVMILVRCKPEWCRTWYRRLAVLAVLLCTLWTVRYFAIETEHYRSHYSHFSAAMEAKLEYWNKKPLDPGKLNYDARMLWTPSMTSATWMTSETFFPSLRSEKFRECKPLHFVFRYLPLGLTFFALLVLGTFLFSAVRIYCKRHSGASLFPILCTFGFTIGFVYIIRYHEFLIIFLSASLALLCRDYFEALKPRALPRDTEQLPWKKIYSMKKTAAFLRILPVILFALLVCHELNISANSKRYYTGDVAMRPTAQLIEWFRREPERFAGKGVAANFTIGPMLRAYAGTGVAMNPQHGLKEIRDASEEYFRILYHGTEDEMADYCRRRNVRYIVFANVDPDDRPLDRITQTLRQIPPGEKRELARQQLEAGWTYSSRYIAGAKVIKPESLYRKFYTGKGLMQFRKIPAPKDLPEAGIWFSVYEFISESPAKSDKTI